MVYEKNRKRKENERWKEYEPRTENERRRIKKIFYRFGQKRLPERV
jgi:hypothetical protein